MIQAHVQENKTSQQEEQIQQKKTQIQRKERVMQWSLIGLFALIWGVLLRLNFHETGEGWVGFIGLVASVILMLELERWCVEVFPLYEIIEFNDSFVVVGKVQGSQWIKVRCEITERCPQVCFLDKNNLSPDVVMKALKIKGSK